MAHLFLALNSDDYLPRQLYSFNEQKRDFRCLVWRFLLGTLNFLTVFADYLSTSSASNFCSLMCFASRLFQELQHAKTVFAASLQSF